MAYKGDIGDTRATLILKFIKLAENEGFWVEIYDPFVKESEYTILELEDAVEESCCIMVLTYQLILKEMDLVDYYGEMRKLNVFDVSIVGAVEVREKSGFTVKAIGMNLVNDEDNTKKFFQNIYAYVEHN